MLCACAGPGSPTAAPAGTPLSARTAVPARHPTDVPWPSPSSIVPAGTPPVHTATAADLSIQVAGPARLVPSGTAVYTLTLRNDGPAPATGIVLADVLPQSVVPVWAQPAQPWCGRQGHTVGCSAGDLRAGDAITVMLDLAVGGTTALVTGTQLAGVTLELSVPTCTIDRDTVSPRVTCHLASLQPGVDSHVYIGVGTQAAITGTLVHTATVVANEADPNRANNRALGTLTVGPAGPATGRAVPVVDLTVQVDGPTTVVAGQAYTYTFTITNWGTRDATDVRFEDVVPSDMNLVAYVPGLPRCEQRGDVLTCALHNPDSDETITLTLVITGYAGPPLQMGPDPVMPGWPVCTVLKERTFLHIVTCELGALKPGQATRVQLALVAIGEQERTITNTATVSASEVELNLLDNSATITVQVNKP